MVVGTCRTGGFILLLKENFITCMLMLVAASTSRLREDAIVLKIFFQQGYLLYCLYRCMFGFMKGKGTTDAIFMARQMQENFRVKGKKLYFGFVDLEKAFDRVPRDKLGNAQAGS